MPQRELTELTSDECYALLSSAQIGRLVYVDDLGPLAIPVNYCVAGSDIVFRAEGGAKAHAMRQPVLAFEVDAVDNDQHSGWSVLVRGPGEEVPATEVLDILRMMEGDFPRPWAFGVHNVWLRIRTRAITGRRLGAERSAPSY
jgi:nitroimidazol reductase NimA-like FMN-containing flavoprotein (pyridoxamine 5'-phosphate oxidase superfamily)